MARPKHLTGNINHEDLTSVVANIHENAQFVTNDIAKNLGRHDLLFRRAQFLSNKAQELLWAIEQHSNKEIEND